LIFCLLAITASAQAPPTQSPQEQDTQIPKGAKLFITPLENGYHIYLAAAIHKKQVPVVIVTDKAKADFELSAVTESEKPDSAKMLFQLSGASAEQASMQIVNLKTGTVVHLILGAFCCFWTTGIYLPTGKGIVSVESSFYIGAGVPSAWFAGITEGSDTLRSTFLMQKLETTDTAPIYFLGGWRL
jgi:hypothetical protein